MFSLHLTQPAQDPTMSLYIWGILQEIGIGIRLSYYHQCNLFFNRKNIIFEYLSDITSKFIHRKKKGVNISMVGVYRNQQKRKQMRGQLGVKLRCRCEGIFLQGSCSYQSNRQVNENSFYYFMQFIKKNKKSCNEI